MAAMTPFTLIILSSVLQCMILCVARMFCYPIYKEDGTIGTCWSTIIANLSNSVISIVVILMLAQVISMPGTKDAAAVIETTE